MKTNPICIVDNKAICLADIAYIGMPDRVFDSCPATIFLKESDKTIAIRRSCVPRFLNRWNEHMKEIDILKSSSINSKTIGGLVLPICDDCGAHAKLIEFIEKEGSHKITYMCGVEEFIGGPLDGTRNLTVGCKSSAGKANRAEKQATAHAMNNIIDEDVLGLSIVLAKVVEACGTDPENLSTQIASKLLEAVEKVIKAGKAHA